MEQQQMVVVDIQALPGSIIDNFDAYKDQLDREMEPYRGALVTESNYKDAYKSRAELKKVLDALETKRKSIKRDYMVPYEQFEVKYKTMISGLFATWEELDGQIKGFDQKLVNEKMKAITEMIDERLAKEPEHIERFVRSCSWAMYQKKWENKGSKFEEIVFEFENNVKGIKDNFDLLSSHGSYAPQMLERYTQDGDISACLKLERILISKAKQFNDLHESIKKEPQDQDFAPFSPIPARQEPIQELPEKNEQLDGQHDFVYPYPEPENKKMETILKMAYTLKGPAFAIKWLLDVASIVGIDAERFNPNENK